MSTLTKFEGPECRFWWILDSRNCSNFNSEQFQRFKMQKLLTFWYLYEITLNTFDSFFVKYFFHLMFFQNLNSNFQSSIKHIFDTAGWTFGSLPTRKCWVSQSRRFRRTKWWESLRRFRRKSWGQGNNFCRQSSRLN